MSALVSVASLLKSEVADVRLNINFNNEIETSKKKIQDLIADFKNLRSKDFIDKKSVNNSIASLEQLEKEFDQLTNKTSVSGTQMEDLRRRLEALGNEYTETSQKASSAKANYKFNIDVDKAMKELTSLKQRIESVGGDTAEVDVLINKLNALGKISTDKTVIDLRELKNEITEFSKITNANLQTSSSLSKESEIRNLINLYNKLKSEEQSLQKQMAKTTNAQSYEVLEKELAQVDVNIQRVTQSLKNLGQTDLGKINISRSLTQDFQSFQKEIDSTTRKINDMLKNKNLDSGMVSSLEKIKAELQSLKSVNLADMLKMEKPYQEMSKLSAKAEELRADIMNLDINIKFSGNLKQLGTDVDNLSNKLKTLGKSDFVDSNALNTLHERVKQIKAELQNIDPNTEGAKAEFERLQMELKECSDAYDKMVAQMRQSKADFTFQTNLEKTQADINHLRQKLVELGRETDEVDKIENKLKELGTVSTDKTVAELQRLKSQLTTVGKTASGTVRSTNSLQNAFQRFQSTISTYSFAHILSNQIQRGVYSIGQTIVELDSAYRDLMKVAPDGFQGTSEQLDEIRVKAIGTGQEVARSAVDIINSTASALQTGIDNIDQAMEYARGVNLFANVSDQEESVADTQMKAILSAYGGIDKAMKTNAKGVKTLKGEYTEMTATLDAMNYAGNNYAVTSADVAMGLSKFASVAKSSGAEAFEAMSYVVGANETVQNANKVGTAMKTIISRMNGLQASAKDGSIYTNKTALALKTIAGINILDGTGQIKDFNDLITEVGEKWESLGKNEKIALAEAIAGKNQLNVFQALMDNWDTALQYQKEYKEGFMVGSAEKENARFVDSLEGRIVALKEECKELVTTVVSSDMAKQMVSMATSVVSAINDILKVVDDAGVSLPVVFGLITNSSNSIKQMAKNGQVAPFWRSFTDGAKKTSTAINNVSESAENATQNNVQLGNSVQVVTQQANQQKGALGKVKGALGNFAKSSFASTVKSVALSSAVSILNGALISLASIAITKAVEGIYNYANAHKIAYEKVKEDIETTKNEIKTMTNAKDDLKKISDEYDKLAKKKKKTNEEQERYAELTNQIAELVPELKIGEDENGNAILALNGSLEKYIDNLDEAIVRQKELLKAQIKRQANEARHEIGKYDDKHNLSPSETLNSPNFSVTSAIKDDGLNLDGDGIKNLKDYVEDYKEILQDRNDKVAELNDYYAENFENHVQLESDIQEDALGNMEDKTQYKSWNKLNDDVKGSMNSLFSTVNWGSSILKEDISKQKEFYKGFDTLSKYITKSGEEGKKQLEGWNQKLEDANYAYQKTGDIDQYKESISGVAEELAKVTDMSKDDWITALTNNLNGSLDEEQMALNEFLKNYNKSIEDLNNGDKVAIKLKAEWKADNDYLTELTSYLEAGGIEAGIDYMVKINSGEIDVSNLSPQLRQLIAGTLDGQDTMSEAESNLNMLLTTYITENGEVDEETWSLIQKAINGELTEGEIKAGITLPDGTEISSTLLRLVNGANQDKPNLEVGVQLVGENLEKVRKEINGILNGKEYKEKRIKIITALEQGDLTTFRQILSELPTDKQVEILSAIEENGDLTVNEFKELVQGTPESVQKKIGVTVEGGKEAEDNLEKIKKNTGDETQTIITIDRNGNLTYQTVKALHEATQDEQQTITTNDNGGRKQLELAGELHRKTYNDAQIISTTDKGGGSVLSTLKDICKKVYNKTQTIWTKYKVTGKKQDSGNDPLFSEYWNSTGGFTNVSDSPMAVSDTTAQSGEFSNIGDSPTATTGASSGGGLQRTGDVSAQAKTSPINSLFTKKTKATTIKVNYDNVWKSVKYGIELFQELENRITRVNNNLSLLDAKMERAVGTKKISYLQSQVKLYKEQARLQKISYDSLQKERKLLASKVKKQGFGINSQGNLTNYEEKLMKLEKNYEKAQKKADDYTVYSGKSEKKKKASEKKKANLEKSAEKAKKALEEAELSTSRYLELMNTEIPNAKKEWQEMQNAIKEANDEIERLKFQDKINEELHAIDSITAKIERLDQLINRTQVRLERLKGTSRIKYIQQENEYIKQQINLNKQLLEQQKSEKKDYRGKLKNYGVKFDDNGNITNYGSVLNKYQNHEDYDKIKQWMEEYIDLSQATRDTETAIISLTNSTKELNDEIGQINFSDKIYKEEHAIDDLNNQLVRLATLTERARSKADSLTGKERVKYLKKENDYIAQQIKLKENLIEQQKSEKKDYRSKLKGYGVKFDEQGNISNYDDVLNKYQNSEEYDKVKQFMDEFNELAQAQRESQNELEELRISTKELNDEIEKLNFQDKINEEEHAIEDLNNQLDRLGTLADRARENADRYTGGKRIKYLEKEKEYLEEQIKLQKELIAQQKSERADYKSKLKEYGVLFDENGNIANQDDVLNKYQNHEDYDKVKQWIEEYNSLSQGMREAQSEADSLSGDMVELFYKIKQAELDETLKPFEQSLLGIHYANQRLANSLELVEMKIERAYGTDRLKLLQEQIKLNEELANIQREEIEVLKEKEQALQSEMSNYGFEFTSDGDIKNINEILNSLEDSSAYEYVKEMVDNWRELHEDEIPNAEKELLDYEEAIKDVYDSQLDATVEIEKEITKMIEDQIEKRKEAIEEQTDAIIKSLEKERQAYKDMREEVDYQNDRQEKLDNIADISKRLEIARKDNSLSNRKKIADLEKELEEAQKDLEEFVQNKIDADIDKAYEDKIDKIQEDSDKEIEDLEDTWTESKIAQAVREALDTGVFTDLDGNIKNLEDAMLEFAQNSADHFSVMGQVIENDLIANLNIALDTVNSLSSIMNELGIPEINTPTSVGEETNNSDKYLTVNGITINIPTTPTNARAEDIADVVKKAVDDALKGVIEGL